jgi:hypothetical protein
LITELSRCASAHAVRDGAAEFQFPTREVVNQALDALRGAGSQIESVIPTTSTLEQVFVKAVDR